MAVWLEHCSNYLTLLIIRIFYVNRKSWPYFYVSIEGFIFYFLDIISPYNTKCSIEACHFEEVKLTYSQTSRTSRAERSSAASHTLQQSRSQNKSTMMKNNGTIWDIAELNHVRELQFNSARPKNL